MRLAGPRRQRRRGHRFSWAPFCLAGFRGARDGRLGWGSGTGVGLGLPGSQTHPGTGREPMVGRRPRFCRRPRDMERQLLPRSRSGPPCQPAQPHRVSGPEAPWRGPRPKPVKPALPPHALPAHSPASLCSTHVLPARHTPGCVLRSRDSARLSAVPGATTVCLDRAFLKELAFTRNETKALRWRMRGFPSGSGMLTQSAPDPVAGPCLPFKVKSPYKRHLGISDLRKSTT